MSIGMYVMQYNGRPGTREKITPGNTATGITAAIRHPVSGTFNGQLASTAVIQNQGTGTAKITIDGTDPAAGAAGAGMFLLENSSIVLDTYEAISNFKAIDNVSGQASKLEVWCYF